ncbi:MAG: 30S ribosome-binding factor RbfA [Clostridiales bacterium]|jgi:ribosome-binding factor A|nr:30S ribosome-binding factor RbfA [Clostridiales bacterium]
MSSIRIERLNAEIQTQLALIFPRLKEVELPGMVSVMGVDVDSDLKNAKVYISVLGADLEKVLRLLAQHKPAIKRELAGALRSVRLLPDLHFYGDQSIAHAAKIERILKDIEEKA